MSETFPILWGYKADEEIRALRKSGALCGVVALPWELIAPHEKQAQSNHGQTLKRLAERGGLGLSEAVAVLEGRRWHGMSIAEANARLMQLIVDWNARSANPERTPT